MGGGGGGVGWSLETFICCQLLVLLNVDRFAVIVGKSIVLCTTVEVVEEVEGVDGLVDKPQLGF